MVESLGMLFAYVDALNLPVDVKILLCLRMAAQKWFHRNESSLPSAVVRLFQKVPGRTLWLPNDTISTCLFSLQTIYTKLHTCDA